MFESFTEKTLEKAFDLKTLPNFIYWDSAGNAIDMLASISEGVEDQKTFSQITSGMPPEIIKMEWMHFYIVKFNEVGEARQFNILILESEFPHVEVEQIVKQSFDNSIRSQKKSFFDFMKKRKQLAEKLDSIESKYTATDRTVDSMSVALHMARNENEDLFTLVQRSKITENVLVIALDDVYKVSLKNVPNFEKIPGCWLKLACETHVSVQQNETEFVMKFVERQFHTENHLLECRFLTPPYHVKRLSNVYYYVPNVNICMWFFVDFIMLQCSNIAISEKSSQTVDKWILKFLFSKTLTVRIAQKSVDDQCKPLRLFGNEMFPMASKFLKISISKASSLHEEKSVVNALLKLLTAFENEEMKIKNDYETALPEFSFNASRVIPEEGPQKTTRLLKLLAPNMFVTDYPRKCLHLPRIVDDKEAGTLQQAGVPVIAFPIKGEGGQSPHWFACNHHENAPFPGLRKNPLKNKHVFPVLPCCYIGDQSKRRGSEYRIYYNNDFKNVKLRKPNEYVVFTTNRCLPENVFGQLPRELSPLFPSTVHHQFFRLGVTREKDSLLACIEKATGKQFNATPSSDELNICRQEAVRKIDYKEASPKELVAYYENYFKIKIIIFSDDSGSFEFIKRGRAKYISDIDYDSFIVVACNSGTVADNLKNPQFELVVCVTNDDKTKPKTLFQKDDLRTLQIARETFYNVRYVPFPEGVVEQILDSFGKIKVALFADGTRKKFEHYRPHPAPARVRVSEVGGGVLDAFMNASMKANALEHAFHFWGLEEFQRRARFGETVYSRTAPETIFVENQEILDRVCGIQRRIVNRSAPPIFASQYKSENNNDDEIIFSNFETLKNHFEHDTFKFTINDSLVSFQQCDKIEFLNGGTLFSLENTFQAKEKYVWGDGKRIFLHFENKIFESK